MMARVSGFRSIATLQRRTGLDSCSADPDGYSAAIARLDRVLVVRNAEPLPRTNLILISGGDVPSREANVSLIPWHETPEDYTAPHDLQVVELILKDGDDLIDGVYDALWAI